MQIYRKFIIVIALSFVSVGASFLMVRSVEAHAEVALSNPAEGTLVPNGLREIAITFTEDVSIDQSTAEVLGPTGATLDGTVSAVDRANRRLLRITTPPLATGAYTVKWRVVTEDDNAITNGEIHFSVTDQPPAGYALSLLPVILLIGALLLGASLYIYNKRRSRK
jgi:methionine-rich copper-binding protein CopC